MGPITGLDDVEQRRILPLPGLKLRPLSRPTRSQSLLKWLNQFCLAFHFLGLNLLSTFLNSTKLNAIFLNCTESVPVQSVWAK
jgi:hypothetical protein